jgi:carboxylesterase 2/para-nitrobenzyl esterase
MLWIPGGLFEYHGTGACPWYDGSRFARDGIVCVTINYRVGAEGFLYIGDGVANLGLLDQLAALAWVRENIAAFGGNPGNVTVFGESAGALSIGTLLSMPRADGLFRRAIVQSGGAHHVSSAATAEGIGRRLAQKIGVLATREAIAAVPLERTIDAQVELRNELMAQPDPDFWGEVMLTNLPWQPVIDGDVIPQHPFDRIRAGAAANVDLLVGSNTEETRLFLVPGGAIDQIPGEALNGLMAGYGLTVERALSAYRELYPDASAGDLFSAVQTDWYWRIPCGWRTPMPRARRAREATCTNSPGARRSSMAASAPATRSRSPSSSTPSEMRPRRRMGQTLRRYWPTPCIAPGWISPRTAIRAGRNTTSPVGPQRVSMCAPQSCRTRWPGSACCGRG